MEGLFCFSNQFCAAAANIERKKIERGVQVVVSWPKSDPRSPTITYEMRTGFDGEIAYRVKFNSSVWASFSDQNRELVGEFRGALNELLTASTRAQVEDAKEVSAQNDAAARKFFRAVAPKLKGAL